MNQEIEHFLQKLSEMSNDFEITDEIKDLVKETFFSKKEVEEVKEVKKEKVKKEKVEKVKKDINLPKKPTNAYILFANDKRIELKDQFNSKDLLKELGRLWNEEKQKNSDVYQLYNQKLKEAKEKYEINIKSIVKEEVKEVKVVKKNKK